MRNWGGSVLVAIAVAAVFAATPACAGSSAERDGVRDAKISQPESDRLIRAVARMYDLDPGLLAAIARVESGGNPQAVSPKGAEGMMQLMPSTASRFGVLDPFDPVSNVLGAARFLAFLRNYHPRRDGTASGTMTLPEMLAAYNAGEGAVDRYRGIPPYTETQQYVRRVLIVYLLGDDHGPLAEKLRAGAQSDSEIERRASVHLKRRPPGDNAMAELEAIRVARAARIDRDRAEAIGPHASASLTAAQGGGAR